MASLLLPTAVVLAAASGLPALVGRGNMGGSTGGNVGRWASTVLLVVAAALGAAGALDVLWHGPGAPFRMPLTVLLPEVEFGLDALSAAFVLPVCLIGGCVAVYDLGYWRSGGGHHPARERRAVRPFLGLLCASLLLLLAARDAVGFLVAWETMALSAFFLVATEHEDAEVHNAGWIYLASTHLGTLVLLAFFGVFAAVAGDLRFLPLGPAAGAGVRNLLFALALVGFGLKAGVVPLHFWLPPAHANAPSHVSALMSGVLIKTGIYGLVRTTWLLTEPPVAWGAIVLGLGALSAIVGVAFAVGQHDLKRLLAYHSIENIGIVLLGLGAALLGRATGDPALLALGLAGAVLHVWNHGLFKALLFLAAGATIRATGTREIDRLGGLARGMPRTAAAFLLGAVAICGLPPLNGFVSELLTYLGLFRALGGSGELAGFAAVAIASLALVGTMALLCFVKVFGAVYLGAPRTALAGEPRDPGPSLLAPMATLALACLAIGLLPGGALALLQPVVDDWLPNGAPRAQLATLFPAGVVGSVGACVLLLGALLWSWLRRRRTRGAPAVGTWDCGYVTPTVRMQYTASSFAQQFVAGCRLLLLPRTHTPSVVALFPAPARFESHVPDPVLDRLLLPGLRGVAAACNWLRALHRGRVQLYLFYVFLTLLCLLLFTG